ncbi:FGGY-family carbohydrate kinase [Pararobbsia alpina]|uniref:Xylulose kinase n=1 Tax=Pararobbsia alpina TaxID=621374 RepID=A0A6S7BAI0_9BURK|nr:FGGY-family carbohydrate kinase [Pararobbsia alpina]CAB3792769.1 Xylulose kinase [Pararobbsia alpina]
MDYLLGIDIGTFESKGTIIDANGAVIARASTPHRMRVPQPGWAEHDPLTDWWGDFCLLSKQLVEQAAQAGIDASRIRAVGCSAIAPCMLPLDRDGTPLRHAVLYGVDTRASREIDELNTLYGRERLLLHCGNALTSQSVGPKILWLKRNEPEHYAQAAKIVSSTTYLVYRLTGETVLDHYTAASFTPLYDIRTQQWSSTLADEVDGGIIDIDKLPTLAWTTDIAGRVTKQAALQTGLAEGTPVIAGTADAAAEAVSVGVLAAGEMMMMYGSTIFIIQVTDRAVQDPRLWYAPWLFPGLHTSSSGLATSGTLTVWFREQFARDLPADEAFGMLAQEAAQSPPGAKGLIMLPYLSGERTPIHDPHARGCVLGLNLTHTRGDLYRAALEGIANSVRHVLETYAEAHASPRRVVAVGGGTKNPLWLQAVSDCANFEQDVPSLTFGASFGSALLAGIGAGVLTADTIHRANPIAAQVSPDPSTRAVYDKQHRIFRELYLNTKDLMHLLG